jgi:hypothetical protein
VGAAVHGGYDAPAEARPGGSQRLPALAASASSAPSLLLPVGVGPGS